MDMQPVGLMPQPDQVEHFLDIITRRWPNLHTEVDFEVGLLGAGDPRSRRFGLHEISEAAAWAAADNAAG